MKLYEISDDYQALIQLVRCGELTEEQIADTLDVVNDSFEEKVKSCMIVRQECLAEAAMFKKEIDRMSNLADAASEKALRLTDYVKFNMEKTGKDQVDAGIFKLTLRKSSVQLGEIDESKIHESFFTTVPESKKLDKRRLLSEAKLHGVDGVELKDGKRSLIVE